jgi:predicted NAD-dependent protein-ADP-ribosyltransferase YbiA (DUF1768 family)
MTLILGDCLIELKKIDDKSVDMVYLDLPFGCTACTWDKKLDLKALWVELKRVARSERTGFFFSCTTKFGFELFNNSPKGYFRWDLVWEKNRAAGFLNAYRLPMRKHEMIYCFAKKTPEYDVSSHNEVEIKPHGRNKPKAEIYGDCSKVKTDKIHKNKLPTSILPPEEDHELIYCFAKKTPAYDVSSHNEVEIKPHGRNKPTAEIYGNNRIKTDKIHKNKLPTSVLPPQEEDIIIRENTIYQKHENEPDRYEKQAKRNGKLPTSVLPQEDTPSSWCKYDVDGKTKHRTSKPVKLMEFLLKYWSKEGDTILDPTFGSGAMAVACQNMNRKFIGIEMCAEFHELATERLKDNAIRLESL